MTCTVGFELSFFICSSRWVIPTALSSSILQNLTPVGPGHITNLTFIFLFSQPASPQPVLMSWGGLKERSDEPEEIEILLLSYWVGVSNKVSVSVVHTWKVIRKNTHFESQIQNSIQIKSDFSICNGNDRLNKRSRSASPLVLKVGLVEIHPTLMKH